MVAPRKLHMDHVLKIRYVQDKMINGLLRRKYDNSVTLISRIATQS